jgi:magnesium chelatase family protein
MLAKRIVTILPPLSFEEVLEVRRQPLEGGQLTISRTAASLTYPARCTRAAAMNPCACG